MYCSHVAQPDIHLFWDFEQDKHIARSLDWLIHRIVYYELYITNLYAVNTHLVINFFVISIFVAYWLISYFELKLKMFVKDLVDYIEGKR